MLDYDRLANVLACVGLLGLFFIVFNVEMIQSTLRRVTYCLISRENIAARGIRHRRKVRRA
jgi:hypothetical protein